MRWSIRHRTEFRYSRPVRESFNEARLTPVSNEHQTVESFRVTTNPPAACREYDDFYANKVHHFELTAPHDALVIESRSTVATNSSNRLDEAATPAPMARRPECARMSRCYDYLHASPFVTVTPDIWRLAIDATYGVDDMWQAAQTLCRFTGAHMDYVPASTHALTTGAEALALRSGVCQDFAHVLLGLCRAIHIPALYVSGYLAVPGAQASHAWTEVFIPDIGWRALDPTHARQADERYIKVAVGRDYGDVPPVRGHYKGSVERKLTVDVEVLPADTPV
jgi:transglutaminase-like putative cysteine protease